MEVSRKRYVHGRPILPAQHALVFDGDAGGIRDCGIGPKFSLGRDFQFGSSHATDAGPECRNFSGRNCDVRADFIVAKILLSLRVDIVAVDFGANQSLDETSELFGFSARGQLAANRVIVAGSAHLWVLLGDVEFLFMAEVGLSHARSAVPARV